MSQVTVLMSALVNDKDVHRYHDGVSVLRFTYNTAVVKAATIYSKKLQQVISNVGTFRLIKRQINLFQRRTCYRDAFSRIIRILGCYANEQLMMFLS